VSLSPGLHMVWHIVGTTFALLWGSILLLVFGHWIWKLSQFDHMKCKQTQDSLVQHFDTFRFTYNPVSNSDKIAGLFCWDRILLFLAMLGQISLNTYAIYMRWLERDSNGVQTHTYDHQLAGVEMITFHYLVAVHVFYIGGLYGLINGLMYLSNFSLVYFVKGLSPTEMVTLFSASMASGSNQVRWYKLSGFVGCIYPSVYATCHCLAVWSLGIVGLAALLAQVRQIHVFTQLNPDEWDVMQRVTFLAFVNNMVGIWSKGSIGMGNLTLAFFGRHDATLQPDEELLFRNSLQAILACLWHDTHLNIAQKIVLTCTFDSKDAQRLFLEAVPCATTMATQDGREPPVTSLLVQEAFATFV